VIGVSITGKINTLDRVFRRTIAVLLNLQPVLILMKKEVIERLRPSLLKQEEIGVIHRPA